MKGLVVKVIREDNDIYDVGESYGRQRWIVLLGPKRYWSDDTIGIVEESALCIGHGSDKLSALLDASATLKYLIEEVGA
jgi:hypothetical protein